MTSQLQDCPEGRAFVHSDCPGGGRVFASFESCPRGLSQRGVVLDDIDSCIKMDSDEESNVEVWFRDGEGEFSSELTKKRGRLTMPENVVSCWMKCCIRLATPLLNTNKQYETVCNKCCVTFYEMLYSFGWGLIHFKKQKIF